MPARAADDYHLYAIDWEKDGIRCWYDGYQFSHFDNRGWNYPQSLEFDVEIQPQGMGTPTPAEFSGTYYVDYIRAWHRVDQADTTQPTTEPAK
jgi:beta-glucanase (GH16 family)